MPEDDRLLPPEPHEGAATDPPADAAGGDPVLDINSEGVSLPGTAGTPAWQPLRLSARHMMMIELHLQGFKNTDIADLLKCHEVTVGLVLRSQPAQDVLKERVEHVNLDFQAQFRQVVDTFADALAPGADLDMRLAAADKWLKAHGHYEPKQKKKEQGKLTIEDVIAEMEAGNVTINVDNRRQTYYSGGPPAESGRREDERWPEEQTHHSASSKEGSSPEAGQSQKLPERRR